MLTRELLRAIRRIVGRVELSGMDVVEVSPPYDHADIDGDGSEPRSPRGDQRPRREESRRDPGPLGGGAGMTGAPLEDSPPEAWLDALARLYDLDLEEDPGDVDLYLALANRSGGPILEIAVGSGRIAVPLAEAGHDVTGLDVDPGMLRRAAARAEAAGPEIAARIHLVEADVREVRLPDAGSFRFAFIPFNSLLVFGDRRDQARAMATMTAHLAPDGLGVVDIWLPDADQLSRYDGRMGLEYVRRDLGTGRVVTKTASARHDASGRVDLTRSTRKATRADKSVGGCARIASGSSVPRSWSRWRRPRVCGSSCSRGTTTCASTSPAMSARSCSPRRASLRSGRHAGAPGRTRIRRDGRLLRVRPPNRPSGRSGRRGPACYPAPHGQRPRRRDRVAARRGRSPGRPAPRPAHGGDHEQAPQRLSDGMLVILGNNEGVPFALANPAAAVSLDLPRIVGSVLGLEPARAGRW